ncbi:MAG TPA: squalene synthase HpnC [Vicinamibacterales bacterium]|nr:squalene synthase HpnC [Vicinamibacterales bacterium]
MNLAQSHYENFPVASWLLPERLRPHIAAIYAFARRADDFADEPGRTPDERLFLLREWRAQLHKRGDPFPEFVALHDTIDRFELPVQLFDNLLDAFIQDVTKSRYATWPDVLDYCRRSANPVGRLVLRISGYNDDRLDRASDAVCTALQLTNFWQDLAVDWSRGRLYVPEETWRAHAADPQSFDQRTITPQWAAALGECASRTRSLFETGRPICDGVGGRLRYELRATWLGGVRVLKRLERSGFDVFGQRPALGIADAIVIACGTLLWRETPHSPTRS